jgi:hypothetical protein
MTYLKSWMVLKILYLKYVSGMNKKTKKKVKERII